MIEEEKDGNTSYPLADAHGDITALTDQSGSISSRQSYDAWGKQTSGTAQTYGYLGAFQRRSDPETGLTQMGARQYEPTLGRFLSEDRVLGDKSLGQGWNRYSYAVNNPLRYLDLDGRWFCSNFVDECLKPAGATLRNMASPGRWDDLSKDVGQGYEIIRSYLSKGCNAANLAVGAVSLLGAKKFLKAVQVAERARKATHAKSLIGGAAEDLSKVSDKMIKLPFAGLALLIGADSVKECFQ